jgi:hypothetical protein
MKTIHNFCTLSLVIAVAEVGVSWATKIQPDLSPGLVEGCSLSTRNGDKWVESTIPCITEVDLEEESSGWMNRMSIWGTREGDKVTCKKNLGFVRFATYAAVGVAREDAHKLCRYISGQLQDREKLSEAFNNCFRQVPLFEFRGITMKGWEMQLRDVTNIHVDKHEIFQVCGDQVLGLTTADEDESKNCQKDVSVDASKSPEPVAVPDDGCYKPHEKDTAGPFNVTIYFVRHGESEWNEQSASKSESDLNKEGKLTDAKLTALGTMQARMLSGFIVTKGLGVGKMNRKALAESGISMELANTDDWKILNGEIADDAKSQPRKVVYATSNLRRASLTFLRAFQHLIKQGRKIDKLHILSALQEPAKNIDSNSLSKPGQPPALTLESCPIVPSIPKGKPFEMDAKCNRGDELQDRTLQHGDRLLDDFCRWMRNMAAFGHVPGAGEDTSDGSSGPLVTDFVIAGHSMFLRGFFQRYMENGIGVFKVKPSKLERMLKSSIHTVGNGALIKIKVELNTHNPKKLTTPICKIIKKNTKLLFGGIHGRNIFKLVLSGMKAEEDS